MKVIILGKGEMLSNLIHGVLLADAEIAGVLRYERVTLSPFRLVLHDFFKNSPELTLIKKHNIYDMKFKSANSEAFKQEVLRLNADIILVGTWKERLKKDIIDLPKTGTINVHPSLLPKYRGPNPYLQTILHGERVSGVTFHLMNENFDAGAILAQAEVEILDGDTSKELKNRTVFTARLLCAELLRKLKAGAVIPILQDEEKATYFGNVRPEDMTLDFRNENAYEIYARVRAFYPFLPTYIQDGNDFYIVNPYKTEITGMTAAPGEIIRGKTTFYAAAKDGIMLKFGGLKKYRWYRKFNRILFR